MQLFKKRGKTATDSPLHPSTTSHLPPKLTVSPTLHPHPFRELSLAVTPKGLLIKSRSQLQPSTYARVGWGNDSVVEEVVADPSARWHGAVIYGILGLLRLTHGSHLLVIVSKIEIGDLLEQSREVYGVKGAVSIPLKEEGAVLALNSITRGFANAANNNDALGDTDFEDDDDSVDSEPLQQTDQHVRFSSTPSTTSKMPDTEPPVVGAISSSSSSPTGSVAKTVAARLSFWKPRPPPPVPAIPVSSVDLPAIEQPPSLEAAHEATPSVIASSLSTEERNTQLEEKIVKECIRQYTREMFFAYDFDITTPIQRKFQKISDNVRSDELLHDLAGRASSTTSQISSNISQAFGDPTIPEPNANLPLWRRVDRRFWWNEEISSSFVEAGLHSYVLPVMQGYIQISTFPSPLGTPAAESAFDAELQVVDDIDYIIISRRSRQRAGLRYQRRGIDEDANVANFVETETIARINRAERLNIFSYIQIRGSIPIYWSQPGNSLKPAPQLDRTPSESQAALHKHFEKTIKVYGPHMAVNLAELAGKEAAVTSAYREAMQGFNKIEASYHEFDFHTECKGMRYENISKLVTQLERTFLSQGFFWLSGTEILSKQHGVFRVNCIDCLDRTNVVQSAFAKHVLEQQLQAVALIIGPSERSEVDMVFNDIWANNGDAISRAYAGTSALKGDYTRTGKRDLSGMLNDGMNSLARMYTAAFSDFFSQAVIDYMLGHRGLSVFSEFTLNLRSTDPRELFRLSKIRAIAIETCTALVVMDGEEVKAGWTLFSPVQLNVKLGNVFEEKVLLLTAQALYIVSYDFSLEKVKMYTRVPLGNVVSLQKGAYIISPLQAAGRDPLQNYGLMVSYRPSDEVTTRITSYSMKNIPSVNEGSPASPLPTLDEDPFASTLPSPPSTPTPRPQPQKRTGSSTSRRSTRRGSLLAKLLTPMPTGNDIMVAAFKALSVDFTKERVGSDGFGLDTTSPSAFARREASCKDDIESICSAIRLACQNVGVIDPDFVVEQDIVSVNDAQTSLPVFAKLEYGVKRLLWLGS